MKNADRRLSACSPGSCARHAAHIAAVLALAASSSVALAQAVKEYPFANDRIYPVQTGLGIATQIEISPTEVVRDFGTGFSSAWDLVRRDNVFYLKPKSPNADTNMYIRTTQRSYLLDLKVVGRKWKNLEEARRSGVNYKVRFRYPQTPGSRADAHGLAGDSPAIPFTPNALAHYAAYDYSVGKDSDWMIPTRVYDDGKFTYVFMKEGLLVPGGVPAAFGRKEENGEDFILNTSYKNNVITVHGVYKYLVLRHGASVLGLRRN